MKLTGHKTEAVYRRYAIVSEADLAAGVTRLAVLHESLTKGTRRPDAAGQVWRRPPWAPRMRSASRSSPNSSRAKVGRRLLLRHAEPVSAPIGRLVSGVSRTTDQARRLVSFSA